MEKDQINQLQVLYLARFGYDGSTASHRRDAMRKLCSLVISHDLFPPSAQKFYRALPMRALRKLSGIEFDITGVKRKIIRQIQTHPFDVLWIDKGNHIHPSIFKTFRKACPDGFIVGYTPDDMGNPQNRSKGFLDSLSSYDIYFTTKSFQVSELEAAGCPRVVFIDNAYHAPLHRPMTLSQTEQQRYASEVSFIGAWEKERADILLYLAEHGIPLRIWGNQAWKKKVPFPPPNMKLEGIPVFGEEYVKALNATKISLGFLRKVNRDLQTTRSIEIPACGAMMLAERTEEHQRLFVEGREVEYFASKEELLRKVRYYLDHPEERKALAEAGRQRCLTSGYSNQDRMRSMLETVLSLAPSRATSHTSSKPSKHPI